MAKDQRMWIGDDIAGLFFVSLLVLPFRKRVDLFSESCSQVAFALYQGMASAMPQGRRFPSWL
jgi:hypothetical protein